MQSSILFAVHNCHTEFIVRCPAFEAYCWSDAIEFCWTHDSKGSVGPILRSHKYVEVEYYVEDVIADRWEKKEKGSRVGGGLAWTLKTRWASSPGGAAAASV